MKKLLVGIGAVIVLLVLAAFIAPSLIPVDTYKSQILAQIQAATGRAARIDGDLKLSVLPTLGITAGKVSLANAPGQSPPQMVTLDSLGVRIALFPLLHGAVVIDSFVLEKPVISLSVDKNGTPNWQFAGKTAAPAAPASAPKAAAPAPSSGGGGAGLSGLTLGDVRLVDGQVTYADARSGAKYAADAINMKVSLPSLSSPMQADGSLVWNQEKISLTLNVTDPNALLGGKQTAVDASVSGPLTLAFKGQVSNGQAIGARGNVNLDIASVRKLAAWAGQPLNLPGTGLGPLKISGTVGVAGAKVDFSNATLALDDLKGTGDIQFDGSGKRPYAKARLALGTLDVNPYLPPQAASPASASPAAPAPAAAPSQDWSDAPIDLAPLRAADADLDLGVDGLVVRKIKIGKSHLVVTLKGGKLVADLTDMAAYQGHGKAKVTADGSQSVPAVALDFDLANFQANPFLSDAMHMNRLEGTANSNLTVTGHGGSQRAIVSSLDGSGKVQFLNGAIRGINLAAMVRNVGSAFTGSSADQKTDFAELGGTFTIKNGILTNNDMAMQSPLLRVSGKGTVDLPKRRVDYRVEPAAVASLQGQGGAGNLSGLMVPVMVEGPWDNLSYRPDLAGAASSLAKGKLQNLLPGQNPGAASGTTPAPSQSPVNQLKSLFGK